MNPEHLQELSVRAEALLFSEGEPITLKRLAQLAKANDSDLSSALRILHDRLQGSGIALIRTATDVGLAVSPIASTAVKSAYENELAKDIGDAGLEVLATLLYRGASTRAEIDFIRGVNTSTTLRGLLARGLVVRANNPLDAREYLYRPSVELLAHLGVTDAKELPDYATIASELASFEAQGPKENNATATDSSE